MVIDYSLVRLHLMWSEDDFR